MTDQTSASTAPSNYINLTADIVSAFVSNNSVPAGELPALIASVHGALQNVGSPAPKQEPVNLTPAVPVKKSITSDAIFSLEDGKGYKSMKRHLARLGMTPQQYREKWGLPRDYPMVAPSYAAKRSELAKSSGRASSGGRRQRRAPIQARLSARLPRRRVVERKQRNHQIFELLESRNERGSCDTHEQRFGCICALSPAYAGIFLLYL